jgi:hypothetical protein
MLERFRRRLAAFRAGELRNDDAIPLIARWPASLTPR